MSEGAQLYQRLIDVLASNDLKQVKSFMPVLDRPNILESLSFYEISDLVRELAKYIQWLDSSDPRGLGGSGKGAKKNDVLIVCRRVLKKLEQKKKDLREKEISSRPDHTEEYKEFLPRGLTRHLDNGPPSAKAKKKKVGSR